MWREGTDQLQAQDQQASWSLHGMPDRQIPRRAGVVTKQSGSQSRTFQTDKRQSPSHSVATYYTLRCEME